MQTDTIGGIEHPSKLFSGAGLQNIMSEQKHRMEPTHHFRYKPKAIFIGTHGSTQTVKYQKYLQQLYVSATGWKLVWQDVAEVSMDAPDVIEGETECHEHMKGIHAGNPT